MHISLIILSIILVTIALRQCLSWRLPIWRIMLIGAVACLLTRQISIQMALSAIDLNVMLYLFGVFALSSSLEQSGLLQRTIDRWFTQQRSLRSTLTIICLGFGIGSALLMNDTLAIIGTPVILHLCRQQRQLATWLLMLLAYSVTIGSVMSPIGNPQNLLIANHINQPHVFWLFLSHLAVPTCINLVLLLTLFAFRLKSTAAPNVTTTLPALQYPSMALWSKLSLSTFVLLVILKMWLAIPFSAIALIAAAPILLMAKPRLVIWRHIDWGTLLFFIGLFIVMQSVWQDGSLQAIIQRHHLPIQNENFILLTSTLMSQLISNVPMVALYLPLLHHTHISQAMALAAGSTMAGNLFLFGAASNVIISDNAEKRGLPALPFWRFFGYGLPITAIGLAIYGLYLL